MVGTNGSADAIRADSKRSKYGGFQLQGHQFDTRVGPVNTSSYNQLVIDLKLHSLHPHLHTAHCAVNNWWILKIAVAAIFRKDWDTFTNKVGSRQNVLLNTVILHLSERGYDAF